MISRLATLSLAAILSLALATDGQARGGFSSGGGRGGFSSSRSFSSPSRSYSSRSYSAPSRTVTTTTTRRLGYYGGGYGYGGHYGYGGYYGYHPMFYPGFGMGYGYSNGLVEGLIIGNLMHPQGTVAYNGGGYDGQALLYPDGRVVNQQGYQVGNYANGQFTAQMGGMAAQPAPAQAAPSEPVVVENPGPTVGEIIGALVICVLLVLILFAIFM